MDPPPRPGASSLFQVYLRLRPPPQQGQQTHRELYPQLPPERFLAVESPTTPTNATWTESRQSVPTHITINPPSASRKRAVEKFAFTRVFEEETTQLEIFQDSGHVGLIDSVLSEGRDGLLATLGVTGSGKSHTILGTKSQRGITQMSLDYLFRSMGSKVVHPVLSPSLVASLDSADSSEGQLLSASHFLDSVYGEGLSTRAQSRATTPAVVKTSSLFANPSKLRPPRNIVKTGPKAQWYLLGLGRDSRLSTQDSDVIQDASEELNHANIENVQDETYPSKSDLPKSASRLGFWSRRLHTRAKAMLDDAPIIYGGNADNTQEVFVQATPRRHAPPPKPQNFPLKPSLDELEILAAPNADYAVVVSMYEVYNDRIFDLLTASTLNARGERHRRALLFKSTEGSPDRKVVAGLRKVVCGSYDEAMMVLETGLTERRVAGTGSNSVSSRSHGFFVVEVKKRDTRCGGWTGGALTIVDLAGSERAKNSKTAGSALAEAGKINESLMYLGQCLQMQSDLAMNENGTGPAKTHLVPFRQCKLTELLFANSFVAAGGRHAQRGIMIVTADPVGDFNATSQILRYSALAREITVPRIPSVATEIGGFTPAEANNSSRPGTAETSKFSTSISSNGRMTPDSAVALGDLVAARGEAERLADEVAILAMRLAEEQARRREAEDGWARAEMRSEEMEREVREECFEAMEAKLDEEKRRWMVMRDEEKDQMDEEMDRKIEMLMQERDDTVKVHEDVPQTTASRLRDLEDENASLRTKLDALEREIQCQSPTKTAKKSTRRPTANAPLFEQTASRENLTAALKKLDIDAGELPAPITKTPGKKMRKLTPRNLVEDDDVFGEGDLA